MDGASKNSTHPRVIRRVPGSFNDEVMSPVKETFFEFQAKPEAATNAINTAVENIRPLQASTIHDPPVVDSSLMEGPSFQDKHPDSHVGLTVREQLQQFESSFAPPISPAAPSLNGNDSTCLFDPPSKEPTAQARQEIIKEEQKGQPDNTDKTLKVPMEDSRLQVKIDAETGDTTSSLEGFSTLSSPTAAATARTASRTLPRPNDGAIDQKQDQARTTGNQSDKRPKPSPIESATAASDPPLHAGCDLSGISAHAAPTLGHTPIKASLRQPRFLVSRYASQHSSVSSDADIDGETRKGLNVECAPRPSGVTSSIAMPRSPSNFFSRSISLGSMASGMDDCMDFSGPNFAQLETLDELDNVVSPRHTDGHNQNDDDMVQTPKGRQPATSLTAPTDTVIARHVRNVQVPEYLAHEYKTKGGLVMPVRNASEYDAYVVSMGAATPTTTAGTRHGGKNLTLKEQSSTIERLSKENFDLKLKVMFLSDRLDKLSEEGVKEMISENVELKTNLAVVQRDNKVLRRRVKELERQLKDEDNSRRPSTRDSDEKYDSAAGATVDKEAQECEDELIFLRERVESYETEVERLRSENLLKEAEKRRMAETVMNFGQGKGEKMGEALECEEEVDVWKDLLEQETARREQGEDEVRRLQEEMSRLKQEMSSGHGHAVLPGMHHTTNIYHISKKPNRDRPSSPTRPMTAFSGGTAETDANGTWSTMTTLVEELRKEREELKQQNAELRREVGAQTSMLTSRNREKERLYQEIEDLKMAQRRGGPAPSTSDSLLDRSASRAEARSRSRASGETRALTGMGMDESEREELESKLCTLRDRNNALKLQNQDLQRELEACVTDYEATSNAKVQMEEDLAQLQSELDAAVNDMVALQAERDEALQENARLEEDFDKFEKEAQHHVNALDDECAQHEKQKDKLQLELNDRTDNFEALQEEMRKMSEAVVRLEVEQDNKLVRIQALEQELAEANQELEELEGKLRHANDKNQRLTVQQESGQSEIAFLREEQEGDKEEIGKLEAALAKAEKELQEAQEMAADLQQKMEEEREQHVLVASKEKHEVEQYFNEAQRQRQALKDENKKLRKSVVCKEVESAEWKERLVELENNLRGALGDLNGTRSSILASINKLQHDLDTTVRQLQEEKASSLEKDCLIKQRDQLLESAALAHQQTQDQLQKEISEHRKTRSSFETLQRTHILVTAKASTQDSRISELELARQQRDKRIAQLEKTLREQLTERNNLLLVLWTRLSALCGTEWAHNNSLINGRALPSLESVATMLPGFSKNLLAAVKTIEHLVGGFSLRIKSVDHELWKEYRALEEKLDSRTRKMERLEGLARSFAANGQISGAEAAHVAKLEDAVRQLRVENHTLRVANDVRARAGAAALNSQKHENAGLGVDGQDFDEHEGGSPSPSVPTGPSVKQSHKQSRIPNPRTPGSGGRPASLSGSSQAATMTRAHTSLGGISPSATLPHMGSGVGLGLVSDDMALDRSHHCAPGKNSGRRSVSGRSPTRMGPIMEKTYILRLRDMENKLRAEREGRILERGEARKRLQGLEGETHMLRELLEREKRKGGGGR